ncbi:hypothetical protein ABK040_004393 [Willaertia magna]
MFHKTKRNLLSIPNQFLSELDEETFKRISTKDVTKKLSYPIYLDFSHEKFQLSNIDAVKILKGNCVKEININNNRFREIENFDCFTKLKRLYASHNEIQKVIFSNFHSHLVEIDLSHNLITSIPECFNNLISLEKLNLSYNMISNYDSILKLKNCIKLKDLNLSFNQIDMNKENLEKVLFEFKNSLKKLKSINFDSNPFVIKLMNYKAVFISHLQNLTTLDGREISLKERKDLLQQFGNSSSNSNKEDIEIIFFDEVGESLKGTSRGLMKRVPSFSRLFSVLHDISVESRPSVVMSLEEEQQDRRTTVVESIKTQTNYDKINTVLENTSQVYLLVAGQKLLRTMKTLLEMISEFSMKISNDDPLFIGLKGYDHFIHLLKQFIQKEKSQAIRECFIRCLVCSFGFFTKNLENSTREEIQSLKELGKFLLSSGSEIHRTTNAAIHQFILSFKGKSNYQPLLNLSFVLKRFEDYEYLKIPKISNQQELNRLSIQLKKPLLLPSDNQENERRSTTTSFFEELEFRNSFHNENNNDIQKHSLISTMRGKRSLGITKFYQEFLINQLKGFNKNDLCNEIIMLMIQSSEMLVSTFNVNDSLYLTMFETNLFEHLIEMLNEVQKRIQQNNYDDNDESNSLNSLLKRHALLLRLFIAVSAIADKFSTKVVDLATECMNILFNDLKGKDINDDFIIKINQYFNEKSNPLLTNFHIIEVCLSSMCHVSQIREKILKESKFMDYLIKSVEYYLKDKNLKQCLGALKSIDVLFSIYYYKIIRHQTNYITSSRIVSTNNTHIMTDEAYKLQGFESIISIEQLIQLQNYLLELLSESQINHLLSNSNLGVPILKTILHIIQMLSLLNIDKHVQFLIDKQYAEKLQKRMLDLLILTTITNNNQLISSLSVGEILEINKLTSKSFISVMKEIGIDHELLKKVIDSITLLFKEPTSSTLNGITGATSIKLHHAFEIESLIGILSSIKKDSMLAEYKDVLIIQLLKTVQNLTVDFQTKQLYGNLIDQCIKLLKILQPIPPQDPLDFEIYGRLFIQIIKQEQAIEREFPQLYSIEAFEENSSFNGIGVQINDTSSRNQSLTVESIPLFANQYHILLKCVSELETSSFVCLRVLIRFIESLENLPASKLSLELQNSNEMLHNLLKGIIDLNIDTKALQQQEESFSSTSVVTNEKRKSRRKSLRKSIQMATRSFSNVEPYHTPTNSSDSKSSNNASGGDRMSIRMNRRSSLRLNNNIANLNFEEVSKQLSNLKSDQNSLNYYKVFNYGMFYQYSLNFWNERTIDLRRRLHSMIIDDVTLEWREELKYNPFKQDNNPFELDGDNKLLTTSDNEDMDDLQLSDEEDENNGADGNGNKITRVHRKSGNTSEFIDLNSRKKITQDEKPEMTMWSYYDEMSSFSANDFYRLVFNDELDRDNNDVISKTISLSNLLTNKELIALFTGIVGLRIIHLLNNNSKELDILQISSSNILHLNFKVLTNTLFGSYRLNLLSIKIMYDLLDKLITKINQNNTGLRAVTNNKIKIDNWREVIQLMDQISQIIQQMNNTLRYRLQFHFTTPTPFSSDERHFLYHYIKLWHLIISTIRFIPFNLFYEGKEFDLDLLNELCQSQLLSFWFLPLPDFAVLLRLLYYHSITEHLVDSDDTRDNRLFGNLYKIQYLEELSLPLSSVTSDKQEMIGISLSNPSCQYINQKRKLNLLLSEICGIYMRYDRFNLYNVLDFIVRLSPYSSETGMSTNSFIFNPSLRNSLFEHILKEESNLRKILYLSKTLNLNDILYFDYCTLNNNNYLIIIQEKKISLFNYQQDTKKIKLKEFISLQFNQIESILIVSPFSGKSMVLKTINKEYYFLTFESDLFTTKLISTILSKQQVNIELDWRLHKSLQNKIFNEEVDEQLLFYCSVQLIDELNQSKLCNIALTNYFIYFLNENITKDFEKNNNLNEIEELCHYEINDLLLDDNYNEYCSPTTKVKLNFISNDNEKCIYCIFPSDFAKVSFTSNLNAYQSV